MRFPKLTQLQSRFAACLGASVTILIIYFLLSSPRFAYAAELGGVEDTAVTEILKETWRREVDLDGAQDLLWDRDDHGKDDESLERRDDYIRLEADHTISPRATIVPTSLPGNNAPGNLDIGGGQIQIWSFLNASLWDPPSPLPSFPGGYGQDESPPNSEKELRRRSVNDDAMDDSQSQDIVARQTQGQRTVYISINTCLQPGWNSTNPQSGPPPQLTLYASTVSDALGPGARIGQEIAPLIQGFANITVNASSTVYLAVSAPTLPSGFSGQWNYELAASTDDYYHSVDNTTSSLLLVDTDISSALLVTTNLTGADPSDPVYQEWLDLSPPFIIFAQNQAYSSAIEGVRNSFCGLKKASAIIMANQDDPQGTANSVSMEMTTWGSGNEPKESFFVRELNASSAYQVMLAMDGNSTSSGAGVVGGGGKVWSDYTNLYTKSDGNCALLFNLTFCSDVAYAVPNNPNTVGNFSQLQSLYDDFASQLYQNFTYSLQLIPCNTTATAQYSLAKNCDDCAAAYKAWLCAVTIPRCDDYTSTATRLFSRNLGQAFYQNNTMLPDSILQQPFNPMSDAPGGSVAQQQTLVSSLATNMSRVPTIIDNIIQPGPYKELLPCDDLCYGIVQSCPAQLGFSCPFPGRGLESGYYSRDPAINLSCNYPGAVYITNSGSRVGGWKSALPLSIVVGLLFMW